MNRFGYDMYSAGLRYLYRADVDGKGALYFAYAYALLAVQKEDVPPSIWSDVYQVHQKLYRPNYVTPLDSNRFLADSLDKMSDEEVTELVSLIYSTHKRMENMYNTVSSLSMN